MYASLLVLAGYLAAEVLLGGYEAAAAVFALGLAEFSFMLAVRGKRHPSLIIEGAVLAGTGILGKTLSSAGYPGAEFVLLELVLGTALAVSALLGRPWLASLMKRMAGFPAERGFAGDASLAMGFLFIVHGAIMGAFLLLKRGIPVPQAVLAFALLYAGAVIYLRRKQRGRIEKDSPRLTVGDDGRAVLYLGGSRLGSLEIAMAPAAMVSGVKMDEGIEAHDFLKALERYLRSRGCRAVRLMGWNGDGLTLEMDGYTGTPAGWNKLL